MLNLKNVEDQINLKLSIHGYDPPQSQTTNWCELRVRVTQGDDYFEESFPALQTKDLFEILCWFQNLAKRELPKFACLSFTEPCIQFKFLSCKETIVRIAINLNHELKPPFNINQFNLPFDNAKWEIIFELDKNDFHNIIDNLEQTIEKYPTRSTS